MSRRPLEAQPTHAEAVRVQKVLALAGFGSRRACEELITAGRVQVNGLVATLGARVVPGLDVLRVDGAVVPTRAGLTYLAVHKPRGTLSAMTSAEGRPCVGDLVRDHGVGLHHVGRLDADSEGLLLVTNDGTLSHRLTHPSYGVSKRYLVEIAGTAPRALGRMLRSGIDLDDGTVRVDDYQVVDTTGGATLVEVVLHEGRKHVVRRMFAAAGHPVRRLVRTAVGPIRLGELRPGRVRRLSPVEVRSLYSAADL